jgi:hypothetical protein
MDMIIYLAIGLVVGAVIGILVGRYVMASSSGDAVTVAGLTATTELQQQRIVELQGFLDEFREKEAKRGAEDNAVMTKLEPVTLMLTQLGESVRIMENERGNQYTSVVDALRISGEKTEKLTGRPQGGARLRRILERPWRLG